VDLSNFWTIVGLSLSNVGHIHRHGSSEWQSSHLCTTAPNSDMEATTEQKLERV
jgi:hypothetical protein